MVRLGHHLHNYPAFDDGILGHGDCTMGQLLADFDSEFLAFCPLISESHISDAFEDYIRDHGSMKGLKGDNVKSETSNSYGYII